MSRITHFVLRPNDLSLKSASGGNNGVTSLAAVSRYWSVRSCGRSSNFDRQSARGVISGRSNSIRRSSACVTGLYASIKAYTNIIQKYLLYCHVHATIDRTRLVFLLAFIMYNGTAASLIIILYSNQSSVVVSTIRTVM